MFVSSRDLLYLESTSKGVETRPVLPYWFSGSTRTGTQQLAIWMRFCYWVFVVGTRDMMLRQIIAFLYSIFEVTKA